MSECAEAGVFLTALDPGAVILFPWCVTGDVEGELAWERDHDGLGMQGILPNFKGGSALFASRPVLSCPVLLGEPDMQLVTEHVNDFRKPKPWEVFVVLS